MPERLPSRNGIPVGPDELNLPDSHMNLESEYSYHNHHGAWKKRIYGRSILMATFRNLDAIQWGVPLDTHQIIHQTYDPPHMPSPKQAYDFVHEQAEIMGAMNKGSFQKPRYMSIHDQLLAEIEEEYQRFTVK